MASILRAEALSKTYTLSKGNTNTALKNVSLAIEEGEFVSVMGPSGSGKSTLLYTISGMDSPSGGEVWLDGKEINGLSEQQAANLRLHKMGFVFQQSNLLKNLSILDNIVLSAYLGKKEKRETINQRAKVLMKQMGVSSLQHNDSTAGSGGQLQRVSICRALINQPSILFADEPTGALNSSSATEIMELLGEVNRSGTTILLVTHDSRVATRSNRVLFILDGELHSEISLGVYQPDNNNLAQREQHLNEWLIKLGF